MNHIVEQSKCCGCGACFQRCPQKCINLCEDIQGFIYPHIDEQSCIKCGLCRKVCPCLNHSKSQFPSASYAAWHEDDEIRLASSSGGVFSVIAQDMILQGGVVFGARFNERWEVIHDYTETFDGLAVFRGSKYSQSIIGDNYIMVEQFLKQGRKVLFTGTPCQIAGLKIFLKESYDNLLTIDIICHGVPSPLVWRDYLVHLLTINNNNLYKGIHKFALEKTTKIAKVLFRDKIKGWRNYHFSVFSGSDINEEKKTIISESYKNNIYMKVYLGNFDLRPICYECPFKSFSSGSDLTLGDFWGIEKTYPHLYDERGVSLVIVNNERGRHALERTMMCLHECKLDDAIAHNKSLINSPTKPKFYDFFWKRYYSHRIDAIFEIVRKIEPSHLHIIISQIFNKLKIWK